jgi:hypothetical protein
MGQIVAGPSKAFEGLWARCLPLAGARAAAKNHHQKYFVETGLKDRFC